VWAQFVRELRLSLGSFRESQKFLHSNPTWLATSLTTSLDTTSMLIICDIDRSQSRVVDCTFHDLRLAMSVTTSTNTVTGGVLHVLTDYDLHHSGNPQDPKRPASPNAPHINPAEHSNPEWWPTNHRRIPDYRPVNQHLDRTLRPDGINGMERTFIFTMLRGVQLNAVRFSPRTMILECKLSWC
jgi:hypothetical protein